MFHTFVQSPVGQLLLTANSDALTGLYFENHHEQYLTTHKQSLERLDVSVFGQTRIELEQFFSGARTSFDIPISLEGTTFQLSVWSELRRIEYGTTISYGELAKRVGNPNASRAVGLANGSNPIAIIVPCHRVIGANGSLTGYGGGLANKVILLDLEKLANLQMVVG